MSPMARWRSIASSARRPSRRLFSSSRCDSAWAMLPFEAGNVLALNAAVRQLGERHVGAMDQLAEGDLEVPCDGLHLARTLGGDLLEERIERLLDEGLLHARAVGHAAVARDWCADGSEGQLGEVGGLADRERAGFVGRPAGKGGAPGVFPRPSFPGPPKASSRTGAFA